LWNRREKSTVRKGASFLTFRKGKGHLVTDRLHTEGRPRIVEGGRGGIPLLEEPREKEKEKILLSSYKRDEEKSLRREKCLNPFQKKNSMS